MQSESIFINRIQVLSQDIRAGSSLRSVWFYTLVLQMGKGGSEKSPNGPGEQSLLSPPPQGPGRCVCLSLSFWPDGRSPPAGTSPHKEPSRAWGSRVPFPAPQLVPGSSVAHPRSTRRSCLPLEARRPPHGPPSCPLRGLALPGIPSGQHSRGENKPGAGGGGAEKLRVRAPPSRAAPSWAPDTLSWGAARIPSPLVPPPCQNPSF